MPRKMEINICEHKKNNEYICDDKVKKNKKYCWIHITLNCEHKYMFKRFKFDLNIDDLNEEYYIVKLRKEVCVECERTKEDIIEYLDLNNVVDLFNKNENEYLDIIKKINKKEGAN